MSYELLIARRLRFKDDGSSGVSPSIVIAIAGVVACHHDDGDVCRARI